MGQKPFWDFEWDCECLPYQVGTRLSGWSVGRAPGLIDLPFVRRFEEAVLPEGFAIFWRWGQEPWPGNFNVVLTSLAISHLLIPTTTEVGPRILFS